MGANILIVEDEEPLTTLLRYNLEAEGYDVDAVARGDEADTRLRETAPDLIVLDWMLPGLSGIELCRRLRARPQTQSLPIIMLTARGEESERVRGLATGADDYLVKPFSVPELLARIRALLRRVSPERVATVLMIGDLELDREKKRVSRSSRPVDLGPTEFRLLEFLMERPGRVFSREQLLDGVWGSDVYIDERTVDVHVGRQRKARSSTHMLRIGRGAIRGNTALAHAYEIEPEVTPELVENVIPIGQRRTILELTEQTCRWPIGDPGSTEFFFCGGNTIAGLPYCAYHSRVAYQPAADRRRDRRSPAR